MYPPPSTTIKKTLKIELPSDPAIPPQGTYLKEGKSGIYLHSPTPKKENQTFIIFPALKLLLLHCSLHQQVTTPIVQLLQPEV
jgi:hypothetical protein